MSGDCCAVSQEPAGAAGDRCPADGALGVAVNFTTVAAQLRGPIPEPQNFRVCRSKDCEVVYFGSRGTQFRATDLWVAPGFKEGGSDLVCYCFRLTRGDLADDLRTRGESTLFAWIKDRVAAGGCACEVRNPSGHCCLADVRKEIASLAPVAPAELVTSRPEGAP